MRNRYKAVVSGNPNYHPFEAQGGVYGRTMQSDTTILYQWHNYITGQSTFAAPPRTPARRAILPPRP